MRSEERVKPLAGFAWMTLAYNVAVILWGAYVRVTGSGAGCGNHWPLCSGVVLPETPQLQTVIEFTHRLTSGLALVTVVILFVWCWRKTSTGEWSRYTAGLAVAVMLNEALLGALLVKLNHVAQDRSIARAIFLSLHFANTLLLLACLAATAYLLSNGARHLALTAKRGQMIIIGLGLLATMTMGITGSLAALGDTLFPASSLRSSLMQDFSSSSYYLLRLRLLHPLVAVVGGSYLLWLLAKSFRAQSRSRTLPILVLALLTIQFALGIANVILLAPIWLQLVHLLVADTLWISLVITSVDLLFSAQPIYV